MATDNLMPQSSTSVIKHFMLRSSTTGQGLTGKVASDFSGKYNIAGGAEVTLSFSAGTAGDAFSSGKICPLGLGKYAWHVPNAVFASLGNVSAVLSVTGGIDVHCEWLVVTAVRNTAAFGANTTAPATPANVTTAQGVITALLPAALVDGRMDASVGAMASNTLTAAAISADAGAELAALVETYIVNEGDATAVMQAIADKIAADWVAGDASPLAIAAAVWANGTRTITGGSLTTAPPTKEQISTQVAADLLAAHGTGSWTTATGFSTPTNVSDAQIAILAKLPAALEGGRIAAVLDSATRVKLDATQPDYAPATPAQVNAQVLDVLSVDTFAELSAPPAATSSLKDKITWLFMYARNKVTQTAIARTLYRDDTTTVAGTSTTSDDGTTFTKGEDA